MQWSPQQSDAIKAVGRWYRSHNSSQVFRLFGFAGTGKTTLARFLADELDCSAIFGSFTGKACQVLRNKGCSNARTLHSICYKAVQDEYSGEVTFELNPDSELVNAGLLIVDEVSMVNEELGRDVLSFGTKVLVLGDPFQLPPVNGDGFFIEKEPDILLTEIHRQALESPIIRMSMDIRDGIGLNFCEYGTSYVRQRSSFEKEELAKEVLSSDQVIVGMNKTRNTFNKRVRSLLGYESSIPMEKERIICLKNNAKSGLLNGGMWSLKNSKSFSTDRRKIIMEILSIDDPSNVFGMSVDTHMEFFGGDPKNNLDWKERKKFDEFDYAYAVTCHKAQGSQFQSALIFDESSVFRETSKRWLYTAVTRASDQVKVIV